MSDEAKLGLIAGVLAVIAVAVFGFPKDLSGSVSQAPSGNGVASAGTAGTSTTPPGLPPAAVQVAKPRE